MNDAALETLTQRLDRMERENRRLKRMGALAVAIVAALVLMAQATPAKVAKVIEAEKYVLRDVHGKRRGELTVTDYGGTALWLTDEDGNIGAALSVVPDGARRLELVVKHGTKAEVVVRPKEGDARVLLYDKTRMPRVAMEVLPDGQPIVQIADKNGKTRAQLFLAANDAPFLSFYDRKKDRTFIAGLGVAQDGSMTLALVDREEQSMARLSVPRGGLPSIQFLDRAGKVLWSTPELGKALKPEK